MSLFPPSTERPDYLAERVEELWAALRQRDPAVLAAHTGAIFRPGQSVFHLPFWGRAAVVTWPDCVGHDTESGRPLPTLSQAVLAYYFYTSDGAPLTGKWIAFTELPDGQFYTAAFQNYTGHELTQTFGNDLAAFARAAKEAGGQRRRYASPGDAAFAFRVLPKVALLVVCWQGDEDFPPSYRVLFDASVSHHLPTDACAILGSILTHRLVKAGIGY